VDDELRRKLVYGLLSMVLGIIAARLAQYITDKILGPPPEGLTY
jgi:hypothetical protein